MRSMPFRLLVALLGTVALSSVASAATQYHLICRGSPDMRVMAVTHPDFPDEIAITLQISKYRGTKASVKTDGSHLPPGQCSWSTNVIASSYESGVFYRTAASNLRISLDLWGGAGNDQYNNTFATLAYHPATSDTNLMWLQNPTDIDADRNVGTIFDADMVFHMYVTIVTNTFILQRTYWTAYPY